MNQKITNLIKGIVVIVIFAAVLFAANKILMLKSEDGIEQMQAFYKQKENTVDVIFLGSSKVYCQIDTGIIWDEYGISGFDLGGAEAPSWVCYYYLKEALKTQKPKVIMYETTIAGYREDVLEEPEVWAITNNYGFKWNKNRIDQLRDNSTKDGFYDLLIPFGSTHSKYKDLKKDDFVDSNNTINYKGFDSRETIVPFERPDMSKVTESEPVNEKHIIYLKKMNELAKENGIPFIVMVSPYVVTEEEQKYFNYVFDVCEEEGIPYIDFNKMYDELQLDFEKDMAENIHLNLSGSKKWTEYLGKYLNENYDFCDHRGDLNYSSWDNDALWNRQDRLRFDISRADNSSKLDLIKDNNNYIIYITFNDEIKDLSDDYKLKLNGLGISDEMLTENSEIIIGNGEAGFISTEKTFEAFIDEKDMKLMFRKTEEDEPTELFVNEERYEFDYSNNVRMVIYDRVLKKVVGEIDGLY